MSKTRLLIHIVFTTKHRAKTIPLEHKRRLYAYMHGIIQRKQCTTLRINGMADHVHLLVDLHPSVSVSDLVRELKKSTSAWLKEEENFGTFNGWNVGYYAASIGSDGEEACIIYIKNQESHHETHNFLQEIKEFAMRNILDWDDRDWM